MVVCLAAGAGGPEGIGDPAGLRLGAALGVRSAGVAALGLAAPLAPAGSEAGRETGGRQWLVSCGSDAGYMQRRATAAPYGSCRRPATPSRKSNNCSCEPHPSRSPVAVANIKLGGLLAGLGGVVGANHPAGQLQAEQGSGRGWKVMSWAEVANDECCSSAAEGDRRTQNRLSKRQPGCGASI